MPGVLLDLPVYRWMCPNCAAQDVTREPRPHTRMHSCPKMGGLTAPMVLEGTRCKIEKVERGDYEGDDICQYDENGKAIMAIVTTRDDGTDCTVLAPTATAKGMA